MNDIQKRLKSNDIDTRRVLTINMALEYQYRSKKGQINEQKIETLLISMEYNFLKEVSPNVINYKISNKVGFVLTYSKRKKYRVR